MVGQKSNIYISVTAPEDDSHDAGYRKPRHTWMISVEHHPLHIPGTPSKHEEPVHYAATRNHQTGVYTVNTHQVESELPIIGNILIVESTGASAEQVHRILEAALDSDASNETKSAHEPEEWIHRAIHGMQQQKIAEPFDIDEFITFAHGYVANRLENEAPALMAYPKVHKDHEKKSSKHKFWISHPNKHKTKHNHVGEASTYGK